MLSTDPRVDEASTLPRTSQEKAVSAKRSFAQRPSNYKIKAITLLNLGAFIDLVKGQARFHDCEFTGSKLRFFLNIVHPKAAPKAFMVFDANKKQYVGFVHHSSSWDIGGLEEYLEDIYTLPEANGAGRAAFEELETRSADANAAKLSWSVMASNERAIGFYNCMNAAEIAKSNIDLSHLLDRHSSQYLNLIENVRYSEFKVETLNSINLIELQVDLKASGISEKIDHLSAIRRDPSADIIIARDARRQIVGCIVVNTNFSSFRTVNGVQLSKPYVLDKNCSEKQKSNILNSLLYGAVEYARATKRTGHLNAYVAANDQFTQGHYESYGGVKQTMTDDPASVFMIMGKSIQPSQASAHPVR